MQNLKPGLYLVATPIGNLSDISDRAREVLSRADLLLAEDTRHSLKLMNHIGLQKQLTSFHDHNEHDRLNWVMQKIEGGKTVALVTDAGTPGISDPGFLLAREAAKRGLLVQSIPGASALLTALTSSGLPMDRFIFEGFFPRKSGRARRQLEELKAQPRTVVFYESPFRIAKTLGICAEVLGPRQAVVARELTKLHEELWRGDLVTLAKEAKERKWVGEITLVIRGAQDDDEDDSRDEGEDVGDEN